MWEAGPFFNPNKAGLFMDSFFLEGGGQFAPPPPPPRSYFKKNLSNINVTSCNCYTIYLKYVESEKVLTSSVIS